MTRLFLSLYIFIALTLVSLSAVLNHVFFDSKEEYKEHQTTLDVLSLLNRSQQLSPEMLAQKNIQARLIERNDIPWTPSELSTLDKQEAIILHNTEIRTQAYFAINQQQLIEIDLPSTSNNQAYFYWYSLAFFVLLGLGIMLWIWPLWRDLKLLQKATERVDMSKPFIPVGLKSHSLVQPIGNALDELNARVRELINTQTELTGAVAHEFRTPLARIKFALEAFSLDITKQGLKHDETAHEQRALQAIAEDVGELETLMQEMLNYTSLEHQEPELNISEIPLIELVEQRVKALSVSNTRNISIHVSGSRSSILADEHFVSRAVDNLLINALKHAKSKIDIELSEEKLGAQYCLILNVEDNGDGIASENLSKVFQPFFRPDSSRDRQRGGAGLGLAIVKRIANWHNASCWAQRSRLGGASLCIAFVLDNHSIKKS